MILTASSTSSRPRTLKALYTGGLSNQISSEDGPKRSGVPRTVNLSICSLVWISTPQNLRSETFETLETRYYEMKLETVAKIMGESNPWDMESLAKKLSEPIPEILEPVTGKTISFFRVSYSDATTMEVIVHHSPTNLEAFETWLRYYEITNAGKARDDTPEGGEG